MFSEGEPSFLWEGDNRLMKELAQSERFRGMKLSGYVNRVDDERQMQFAALLITIDESTRFVSFRGTDNTIVGWQEDFNLFFTFPLASQFEAKRYWEEAADRFGGSFYLEDTPRAATSRYMPHPSARRRCRTKSLPSTAWTAPDLNWST